MFSTILKLAKEKYCVADECEDDGSDTEQEVALTLDEAMNAIVFDDLQFITVSRIRSATHTLQLAICDDLKMDTDASSIIKIRRIGAVSKMPNIDAILKRKMDKGAILHQVTRWDSTHFMVERLLELKDTLIWRNQTCLSKALRNNVKNLECLLRHTFLFIKKIANCLFDA